MPDPRDGLTVRACLPGDEEVVVALWRACGLVVPANEPHRDFARKLAFQPGLLMVAEDAGAVVGAIMAGYEGHRGWIYYLGVRPDRRLKGIGRRLVEEAESRLRTFGCPKVNLMVRHSNPGVVAFYEKLGFARDEVSCMGRRLVDDTVPRMEPAAPADVTIRPHAQDDAEALFEAAISSQAEVHRWLPWCHPDYRIEETREWVGRCTRAWAERTEYNFVIVDGSGTIVGGCGLNRLGGSHHAANLGYWVRTLATGRGVATTAVRLLVEFAFTETDLERLEIVASLENHASRRVAEKSGAIPEGVSHSRLSVHGKMHDAAVYAFVRRVHGPR
jgi:RimJ/RimL family protein N-acetyltransferase